MSAVTTAAPPASDERLAQFVPTGIASRYKPPRAWIDPDQSKSWLGRARPIDAVQRQRVFAHMGVDKQCDFGSLRR